MHLIKKGTFSHRGVIGVESAIVMIAFVIVAAALAFVVLNMGFSTTQKAKTSIISSLGEASSSIEIAGKITGIGDVSPGLLNVTNIPIKIASGGDSINLSPDLTSITYLSNSVQYDDVYVGILNTGTYRNATLAIEAAVPGTSTNAGGAGTAQVNYFNANTANSTAGNGNANTTSGMIYFSVNRNNNFIIDQGEHANLVIQFEENERPSALDTIRVEIMIPTGAALTIERQVPNITNLVTDLG